MMRRDPFDQNVAEQNRRLVSREGIEADIASAKAEVAGGSRDEGMESRLAGLLVSRRLLDAPEKCKKPPRAI
jgi:hypothetical protein